MYTQTSIQNPITIKGIGIHSGENSNLRLLPAPPNTGILFRRVDVTPSPIIEGNTNNACESNFCSVIKKGEYKIFTIEHLLAALNAFDIDNLYIEINNKEIPILDGSAIHFCQLIEESGRQNSHVPKKYIKICEEIFIEDEDRFAGFTPSDGSEFNFTIDFKNTNIGEQKYSFLLETSTFQKEIARARTFGFIEDEEKMKKEGFIKGVDKDNAIIIDKNGIIFSNEKLRFENELVRHKILDSIGDMKLAGYRIKGKFTGIKSSHKMNIRLLKKLLATPSAYKIETYAL